jgi:hypothetical protein
MSKRLEILKASLIKKEAELAKRISENMATVRETNGQPLIVKMGKQSVRSHVARVERQNNAIRTLTESIEVTKRAIEVEGNKMASVAACELPDALTQAVKDGLITQWRRFPNTFFVVGVEKGRIVWKDRELWHRYGNEIPTIEQRRLFNQVYSTLRESIK